MPARATALVDEAERQGVLPPMIAPDMLAGELRKPSKAELHEAFNLHHLARCLESKYRSTPDFMEMNMPEHTFHEEWQHPECAGRLVRYLPGGRSTDARRHLGLCRNAPWSLSGSNHGPGLPTWTSPVSGAGYLSISPATNTKMGSTMDRIHTSQTSRSSSSPSC
ncbi:hypothetical protein N658DRAFT_220261 [Parathielavia hyrcaniae]|uniref:Uncharacterized protein n=1 Tax=Parathielavia hyrcaniae TaxID=113614 RepID=A0AAN6SYH5_9PEZI|nr:hypothetical protein N658DRAFT_220261 [Parathielavia hyrcaniae]